MSQAGVPPERERDAPPIHTRLGGVLSLSGQKIISFWSRKVCRGRTWVREGGVRSPEGRVRWDEFDGWADLLGLRACQGGGEGNKGILK